MFGLEPTGVLHNSQVKINVFLNYTTHLLSIFLDIIFSSIFYIKYSKLA